MEPIAWRLSTDGRELGIYKIDPATRRMTLLLPLKRNKPMTPAEAQRYVDDNYPKDGTAISVAADALGARRK